MKIKNNPITITLFRFITSYVRVAFQNIILPVIVLTMVQPEYKGRLLSKLLLVSYTLGISTSIIFNSISDRIHTPIGRRKPLIIISGLSMLSGIFIFLQAQVQQN